MASGKKRTRSHRSPNWKPKAKPQQTVAEQRVAKIKTFPIWGAAFLSANIGLVVIGGVVSILLAVAACILDWMVLKRQETPTAKKILYCTLILLGSWVLWIVLMMAYQALFY